MKRTVLSVMILGLVIPVGAAVVPFVDPFVGTSGNGHTTPAAARPFGMVQAGPDTGNGDWHHCSGYRFEEATLRGFSQTHLSGTGGADLGDFRLLPFCGAPGGRALPSREEPPEALPMDKATERAEPGYYAVTAGGIRTEIAAARRYAVYRFAFPEGAVPRVLFDNAWTLNADGKTPADLIGKMRFAPDANRCRFTAYHRANGWAKGRDVYCAAQFSVPWEELTHVSDGRVVFTFASREFELRIALSRTDEERARRNLGAADFAAVRDGARAEWESVLSRVEAKGTRDELVNLYTALYHLCYQPNDISDEGEKPYYSTFSLWDTFRAAHPLYTELVPERVPGMVDSMLADERKNGYLPIWTLWGVETQCMIGTHSVPVIVDAYLKGLLPQVDTNALKAAIHRTLCWELGRRKDGWPIQRRFGFYPQDLVEHESVSRTLECAYDDACAARFAAAIGDKAEEAYFRKLADGWRNVFDAKTGFMRPRNLDGAFVKPFSPFRQGYGSGFTEGDAWQYTWHVLHEPEALIVALGGKEAFCAKLEALFRQPEKVDGMETVADATGLIGQYAHGNEPSHHVAFLFALAGRPEQTDELVREICAKFYRPTPDGLCGNDDCGQMSAWYVYACLGRYPVDPCGGRFVTFTPVMKGCRITRTR